MFRPSSKSFIRRAAFAWIALGCLAFLTAPIRADRDEDHGDEHGEDHHGDHDEDDDPFKEQRHQLHQRINAPALRDELRTLTPLTNAESVNQLTAYFPNTLADFRLEGEPDASPLPAGTVLLSAATLQVFIEVFEYPEGMPGAQGLRSSLLAKVKSKTAARVIVALQAAGQFHAALEMAVELGGGNGSGAVNDALKLSSAYGAFLGSASNDPALNALLNAAAASTDSTVAARAQLFREAISAPVTFEALALGYQLWQTLFLDLHFREKYGRQAAVLAQSAQAVFTSLEMGSDPDRLAKMARVLEVATSAAFQYANEGLIDWAVLKAQNLGLEGLDGGLSPKYGHAYLHFTRSTYADAATEFESVFSTQTPTNVAADAGIMLAQCFVYMDDDTTALATLQLVLDVYPGQAFVIQKANGMMDFIRDRTNPPGSIVDAVIEKRFGDKFPKAVAARKAVSEKSAVAVAAGP